MKFVEIISGWINRYFSNEEAIFLIVSVVAALLIVIFLGTVLAPVLTGLAFAFLLEGTVARLNRWRVPRLVAICMVELLFLGALIALVVGILPVVWAQLGDLVAALPSAIEGLRDVATELARQYPEAFSENAVDDWSATLNQQTTALGAAVVQGVLTQLPNVLGVLIFLILTPIALFFFLKDKDRMFLAFKALLPRRRLLLGRVGADMGVQIANYVRGKLIEIVIVALVTYITLSLLGLNYAALLGLMVGVSVLIPYVGAAVVTVPVAAVGLLQFGWTVDFLVVMTAYAIIQGLDGNILVPVLFSKAVNLHPISIILAVLVFGGIWGIWGVFFAIPLATLVKAIYNAWPMAAAEMAKPASETPA